MDDDLIECSREAAEDGALYDLLQAIGEARMGDLRMDGPDLRGVGLGLRALDVRARRVLMRLLALAEAHNIGGTL